MAGTETLSLGYKAPAGALRAPVGAFTFALAAADAAPAAPAPARRAPRQRRRPEQIDEQDVGNMRELVLGAYLAPQHYREGDGTYVAAYTTERLKGEFIPAEMLDERAKCLTPVGTTNGRLPKAYVAALAKGTTRVIASETRPKKKSSIPLGPLAFQDARVAREVGQLAPEQGQWLRYAYGDSKVWDDEAGIVCALWARVEPLLGKLQTKTRDRTKALVHLAVQEGKSLRNSGRLFYSGPHLAQLVGVTETNWRQHWAERWAIMADELFMLDREALRALAKRLEGYDYLLVDRGI